MSDKFPKIDMPKLDLSSLKLDTSYSTSLANSVVQSMTERNAEMQRIGESIRQEKLEAIEREELTIELLKGILEKDPHIHQKIGQYFNNSTVGQAQNVQDHASGTMIVSNTNVDLEEYKRLRNELNDILDLIDDKHKKDLDEVIDSLDLEIQSPSPKRGIIKAGVSYIKGFLKDVTEAPTKLFIKAQYSAFLQEKAPDLIKGFSDFIENIDFPK